jgi:hypothetical protein
VFLIAVPIAVVGFVLALLLPEIELRRSTDASESETPARPVRRTSLREVEHALSDLARREHRPGVYVRLAEHAGVGDRGRRLLAPAPRSRPPRRHAHSARATTGHTARGLKQSSSGLPTVVC